MDSGLRRNYERRSHLAHALLLLGSMRLLTDREHRFIVREVQGHDCKFPINGRGAAVTQPLELFDSTGQALSKMPDEIRPSTNGVIFNPAGEILLQKRADNGYWGLPGGKVDIGESVEQGAIREVLEETGLHVATTRLIGIYSDPKHYSIMTYEAAGWIIHYVTLLFECELQSGRLQISDESTDIGYFSPNSLPENTLLSHHLRIADAMANQAAPFIR